MWLKKLPGIESKIETVTVRYKIDVPRAILVLGPEETTERLSNLDLQDLCEAYLMVPSGIIEEKLKEKIAKAIKRHESSKEKFPFLFQIIMAIPEGYPLRIWAEEEIKAYKDFSSWWFSIDENSEVLLGEPGIFILEQLLSRAVQPWQYEKALLCYNKRRQSNASSMPKNYKKEILNRLKSLGAWDVIFRNFPPSLSEFSVALNKIREEIPTLF